MDAAIRLLLFQHGAQSIAVPDIDLIEGDLAPGELFHTLQRAGTGVAEIIHHNSLVTCRQQLHHRMRSNITGAAGN